MITLNGKVLERAEGLTVEALLRREGFHAGRVVTERNREILPKEQYASVTLCDGDSLEVLQFVGGG